MIKRIIGPEHRNLSGANEHWLNLDTIAHVEVTSEDMAHRPAAPRQPRGRRSRRLRRAKTRTVDPPPVPRGGEVDRLTSADGDDSGRAADRPPP